MPQVEKLLVFVASPGDVPAERRHVEDRVNELNRTIASDKGVVLQVVRWEEDAFPGYGQDAQALINAQIATMASYALFIGIMWNRVGTPTPRAESGTIEEFHRAVEARHSHGAPEIWFYFRDSPSKLETEEQLEQRRKVLLFRKDVQSNGMPWTYKTPSDFRDKFHRQMIKWLTSREAQIAHSKEADAYDSTLKSLLDEIEDIDERLAVIEPPELRPSDQTPGAVEVEMSIPFISTSAFDSAKSSGHLNLLSSELQSEVSSLYEHIRMAKLLVDGIATSHERGLGVEESITYLRNSFAHLVAHAQMLKEELNGVARALRNAERGHKAP